MDNNPQVQLPSEAPIPPPNPPPAKKFFSIKKLLLLLFTLITIILLFQYKQYANAKTISCGGDWSYMIKCPVGTYCRSLNMGPLAGGVCTPRLSFLFDLFALNTTTPTPSYRPLPTPTPANNWKTYINTKYGFELIIPAKGLTQKGTEFSEVECGNAIKENAEGILIDDLLNIKIINWEKSINNYIVQKGAKEMYELNTIVNSNADEAVEVIGLKKGIEVSSVGYPPLMYISHIYKKNNRLFLLTNLQNTANTKGCINPKELDQIKYPQYADLKWNLTESLKFRE